MKSFLEWFRAGTKVKRWIFLIVVGITLVCYAFAQVLTSETVNISDVILKIIITFVIGFICIVLGIIFIQKRNLEILIEASDVSSEKRKNAKVNIKSLIFNRKVYDEGPKVVVIGGGEGLNTVIRGLKKYTNNITAIVTMSEYGENPSRSREILDLLPSGDIKGSISALSDQEKLMNRLMNFNFKDDRLKDLNFGDIYLLAMSEIYDNTSEAIRKSTEVLNITGQVLPVTLDEIKICAELSDGTTIERKSKILEVVSERIETINRVYISPSNCKPAPGVLEAISEAEAIIIGPGSLYTNVLPNLLVKNVAKTIKESKAPIKLYISNIMTEPGQTDNYTLSDHIRALHAHVGRGVIDYCLADTTDLIPEYVRRYNMEGSDIVELDANKVTTQGIKLIKRDLACINSGLIRHDSDKVAQIIMELICNELKFKDLQNDPEYMLIESVLKNQKKYIAKLEKKNKKQKNIVKKATNKVKSNERKSKSKFASKYKDRVKSIQSSDTQTIENRKIAEEIAKMEAKLNKKVQKKTDNKQVNNKKKK